MQLKDRVALVTGASRGIGRQVAVSYAKEGADVILVARDARALEETADAVRSAGRRAFVLAVDLAREAGVGQLASIVGDIGRLDILVGNAAVLGPVKPIADISALEWEELWAVNVMANLRLVGLLHPYLFRSSAGRGIFVTSYGASMHLPNFGGYGLSKAALESAVKTYAGENAAGTIRANLLNPGGVATDMRRSFKPDEDPATLPSPADVAPLFVELALPGLTETGKVFSFRDWQAATRAEPRALR